MPKKEHQLSDDSVEKSVEPKAPSAASEPAAPAPIGMRKRPLMPKNWTLRSRERYDFISMAVPPT